MVRFRTVWNRKCNQQLFGMELNGAFFMKRATGTFGIHFCGVFLAQRTTALTGCRHNVMTSIIISNIREPPGLICLGCPESPVVGTGCLVRYLTIKAQATCLIKPSWSSCIVAALFLYSCLAFCIDVDKAKMRMGWNHFFMRIVPKILVHPVCFAHACIVLHDGLGHINVDVFLLLCRPPLGLLWWCYTRSCWGNSYTAVIIPPYDHCLRRSLSDLFLIASGVMRVHLSVLFALTVPVPSMPFNFSFSNSGIEVKKLSRNTW